MQRLLHSPYRLLIILLFVLVLPVIINGAIKALQDNSNDVRDWLPESFEETKQLYWFGDHFGSDEILMISWDGCTLDDPKIGQFAEKLCTPKVVDGVEAGPFFRQVYTFPEAMATLTGDPFSGDGAGLGLSQRAAIERLEGWLVGKDHLTTGLLALIAFPKDGNVDRHAAIEYVYECADQIDGLSRESIYAAGTTIESVAIDNASNDGLTSLTIVSFTVCLLIIWLCFRSVVLAMMVFSTALLSQQMSLALIHYSGGKMDSVLLMVPSLVYVLGISAGVHLVNYYRDAIADRGPAGAASRAVNNAWTPCLLAAGTTALGLISLTASQIVPVQKFGFYSAVAVLLGVLILIVLLPCELEQFPLRRWIGRQRKREETTADGNRWSVLHRLVTRGHLGIVVAACLLLLVACWGVSHVQTTVRLHDLFTPHARVLRDYDRLEATIGPLIPVEIIIKVPPIPKPSDQDTRFGTPVVDRLQLVQTVHETVRSVRGVDAVISAATFAPELPKGKIRGLQIGARARRIALEKKLAENRHQFIRGRFLADTPQEELWRISARVNAGSDIDYENLLTQLKQAVGPVLTSDAAGGMPGVKAVYCGAVPLVYKAQDQLLRDLINSFLIAFGFIALVMIVLLRNVAAGLLSMIPNILPCIVVFGVMGFLEVGVEIGSMLTATAALGIAVDDTLHFITWFRRGMTQGKTRAEAVRFAYARCGTAMIQTTLICGLGLLVMRFSQFMPIVRFAWMMFYMLSAALFCDLVILPAILIGPLGRVFQPKKKAEQMPAAEQVLVSRSLAN